MDAAKTDRSLSLVEAIIPIASLILLISLSYYLFGDAGGSGPNQVALVVATIIAVFIAWRRGYSIDEIRDAATASVSSGLGAIFILLAIGSLIGTWALCGTLVAMIYYGLQMISPSYFYVTSCIICAAVSASIGSSWTVTGTIGVGLMGISLNMGLDPAITAGAIISGAYFGDTVSPLSDSANLAAAASGVKLYTHIGETALTSAPALAIALAVFWSFSHARAFDSSASVDTIMSFFHITPILFLPLLVVVVLAMFKFPPFSTIFVGALVAGVLAVLVAPERVIAFADAAHDMPRWLALFKGVWLALASGYVSTTGHAMIDQLVTRGGMESMLNTIWLIIVALAFGGVVEKAGVLERLITPIIDRAKSMGALIGLMVAAVFATNVVTADQYISIVLPGRMFKGAIARRGLAPVVLSRSIGASGTPSSVLIPWNSCGAYMAATLGIATFHYLPYAVFSFVSPLLPVVFAILGFRMLRAPNSEGQSVPEPASSPPPQRDD
jgi:NhaC family Na+:H+ antiporter